MRFQTKLLLSYSLIIVLLVIVLGIGFYGYSAGVFERNARSNLLTVSDRMAQQLDNTVKPMDFITTYLLSDGEFMSSMASMAYLDRSDPASMIYVNEGWRLVKATLLSYSIARNFYAVNAFNRSGDFLSSNLLDFASTSDPRPRLPSIPWIARTDELAGRALLAPPYDDPWAPPGTRSPAKVYCVARAVQGPKGPIGYIEVQNPVADLERLFSVPKAEDVRVYAFCADGTPLYLPSAAASGAAGPLRTEAIVRYAGLAASASGTVALVRDPASGRKELVAAARAAYSGVSVLLVQGEEALLRPLAFTRNLTVLVGALIILVSFLYDYLFARQLAGPIHRLKVQMEGTELENLPEAISLENPNDEIEALNAAFLRLRERLGDSVRSELESRSLQERARFDSLQAQVSPHFLYNILTVIANKGLEAGSDEIGDICAGIADMLRYSTSTTARSATIEEELSHARSYLFLMKKRMEHRLEFSIDVDPAILGERIPKIVLQQLAENSISHGFDGSRKAIAISIAGGLRGDRWRIELRDDGRGFDPGLLESLRLKFTRPPEGSAIGGMGLVNLYSRFAIFYAGDFEFEIGASEGGGASVAIGARLGSGRAD